MTTEEHLAQSFAWKDARIAELEKDRETFLEEAGRLRTALLDAIECVDFWGSYASDYFKEKHDLAGEIARLTATATTKPQETE